MWLAVSAAAAGCAGFADELGERVGRSRGEPDAATVAAGLREALNQGTHRAVAQLGRTDGFWRHPTWRIPVPENLRRIEQGLRRIGQGRIADEFLLSLNRAAEQATPAARGIFLEAIRQMTIRDALDILRGPPDAATAYFRRHTDAKLAAALRPVVARATQGSGVTAAYKDLVARARPLGLVDTAKLDIDEYVTRRALDGVFGLVADEEQRIRRDPAARTTELLRIVFR